MLVWLVFLLTLLPNYSKIVLKGSSVLLKWDFVERLETFIIVPIAVSSLKSLSLEK